MLIDSQVTTLLEGVRKLQHMVQSSKGATALEKIRSQEILTDCEESINAAFGIKRGVTFQRVKLEDTTMTSQELTNKVTTLALDANNIFSTLQRMPATRGKNIKFLNRRNDNHLVRNRFTGLQGHIRAEFGGEKDLFYIIQYQDGTYNIAPEVSVELL